METKQTGDIFSIIAKRDASPAQIKTKIVKRYQICYAGKISRKIYTYASARTIVARLNKRGCDAYYAAIMIRV